MIAASILEYMFISVTCCEEIAKKNFWNTSQLFTHTTRASWRLSPHHCLANSHTFHDLAFAPQTHFAELSRSRIFHKPNSCTFHEAWETCKSAVASTRGPMTPAVTFWSRDQCIPRVCCGLDLYRLFVFPFRAQTNKLHNWKHYPCTGYRSG